MAMVLVVRMLMMVMVTMVMMVMAMAMVLVVMMKEDGWKRRRGAVAHSKASLHLCSFCSLCGRPPCLPPQMPTLPQSRQRCSLHQAVCRDFLGQCLYPLLFSCI